MSETDHDAVPSTPDPMLRTTTTETSTIVTPQGGTERSTTVTDQPMLLPAPPPWLSRHLQNVLLLGITGMVMYLAYLGEEQARQSLYSAFTLLAGVVLGSRAALKVPGKDS